MVFQETQHEVYSSFKYVCGVSSSVWGSKLEGAALLQMGNKALRDNRRFPSKLISLFLKWNCISPRNASFVWNFVASLLANPSEGAAALQLGNRNTAREGELLSKLQRFFLPNKRPLFPERKFRAEKNSISTQFPLSLPSNDKLFTRSDDHNLSSVVKLVHFHTKAINSRGPDYRRKSKITPDTCY